MTHRNKYICNVYANTMLLYHKVCKCIMLLVLQQGFDAVSRFQYVNMDRVILLYDIASVKTFIAGKQ